MPRPLVPAWPALAMAVLGGCPRPEGPADAPEAPVEPDTSAPGDPPPTSTSVATAEYRWILSAALQNRSGILRDTSTDYTGDGIADAVLNWPVSGPARNTLLVPGPLARDLTLPADGVAMGDVTPAGDANGDGIGDLWVVADDLGGGLAFGPFDAAPADRELLDVVGSFPWFVVETDAGPLYALATLDQLELTLGPFEATVPPPFLLVEHSFLGYDPRWSIRRLPGEAGPMLLTGFEDDGYPYGCFELDLTRTGVLDPETDPDLRWFDQALCQAVAIPDQDGDGIEDLFWSSAWYPGPARPDALAAAPTPVTGWTVQPGPDADGDGRADVVVVASEAPRVRVYASGEGWATDVPLLVVDVPGESYVAPFVAPDQQLLLVHDGDAIGVFRLGG